MKVRIKHSWARAYPELTLGNVYRVVEISGDSVRVVDDAGEPILFPSRAFEVVDATVPDTWEKTSDATGRLHASPPELADPPYFFERFFDYDQRARSRFHGYLHKLCFDEVDAIPPAPNEFLRVHWRHSDPAQPLTVYSELDEARWEIRKVEVFADGRTDLAFIRDSSGRTLLAEAPVPPVAEIASDTRDPVAITRDEFEAIWTAAFDAWEPEQPIWIDEL